MKNFACVATYVFLVINTLLVILYALSYYIYEVDLFLVVWLSSMLAIISFPVGILLSIYALSQKDDLHLRKVTLFWNILIISLCGLAYRVLPTGTERVPYGMEKQYLSHQDAIQQLCRYATDTLLLPDSTALAITEEGDLKMRKVVGRSFLYPTMILTRDTSFDIDEYQAQHIRQLHKASGVGKFTVFQPDSLVNIYFISRGFGSYWFEIPHHPYTEEDMFFQLNNIHSCPYLPEVCFLFDGGAIGHDHPFPKEGFLQSHKIDSTYIHHLYH